MNKRPAAHQLVSIVIPARNEAADIARTLDACLAIDYDPKEIIVVDDSTDDTPAIVAAYAGRGVRLVRREFNHNGCCGARNLGMQTAKGEIVVLLNADGLPAPDFLTQIVRLYEAGADFVIVKSVVKNRDNLWGAYKHAASLAFAAPDPLWSEGFSCRRAAARAVGCIPGDFPVPFCRDWMLGAALQAAGYVRRIDRSIALEHIWPDRLRTFWANQINRGFFAAPSYYYFRRRSLALVSLRETVKAGRTALFYLLVAPKLWRAWRLARQLPGGWRAVPAMWAAGLVDDLATVVGGFKGLAGVWRAESRWFARRSAPEMAERRLG